MDLPGLREELDRFGQSHLLQFWDTLTDEQKKQLYQDFRSIDLPAVVRVFKQSTDPDQDQDLITDELLEPLPDEVHESVTTSSEELLRDYREEGLRQIADGRVAVLLMAGGQGTRLGVNYPKGMYNVGLPSNKTLYQLQGERIRRLEQLALDLTGRRNHISWYIMTSEHTKEPTEQFFAQHEHFGLDPSNVVLFEQQTLPCFDFEGRIILERPWRIARAPDGNGGLYAALRSGRILDDMDLRGIQYVHVYGVDNILVKIGDPTFVGYCVRKSAQAGAKVVHKAHPDERVGVIAKVEGRFRVVEYSEISKDIAARRNQDGRLTFNAGSICNHFFTLDFLKLVSNGKQLKHHIAEKKIPFVDDQGQVITPPVPNGYKLEKFVFDVFHFTDDFAVWEVLRQEEFSPLKNADSPNGKDSPRTARQALYDLHRTYVERAGGQFTTRPTGTDSNDDHLATATDKLILTNGHVKGQPNDINHDDRQELICEISPLLSYDGEGLRGLVEGRQLSAPLLLLAESETGPTIATKQNNGTSTVPVAALPAMTNGVH